MAGLYTGLALGFSRVLCRPCLNSRSLLATKAPLRPLFTLRTRTGGLNIHATRVSTIFPLPGSSTRQGLDVKILIPCALHGQRATFVNVPEFPMPPKPEVIFKKKAFDSTENQRKQEQKRRSKYWRQRRTLGMEWSHRVMALRRALKTRKKGKKRKKLFGRRKAWTWRWLRKKIRRTPVEWKSRLLPWNRRRRHTWIKMRDAYHRKFFPILRRKARLPFSISTLDPEKLQSSDYMNLSWNGSVWITTEMLLPLRMRPGEELDEDEDFLEDWREDEELEDGSQAREAESTTGPSIDDVEVKEEPDSSEQADTNPALHSYRRWDIPRFVQKLGHPADATDPESLRKVPFPPRRVPPKYAPRKWDIPRLVRGRRETRQFRRATRRQNKNFRENILKIKKRPLFYWYKFPFPPSIYEPRGGFIYLYKPPPGEAETAVGLRFRITNDSDPKSFVYGKDLTYQGVPWMVPLHYGPIRNPVIRRLLFKDDLLPLHLIRRCGALRRKTLKLYTRASRRFKRVKKAVMKRDNPKLERFYELHRDTNPYTPFIHALGQPFRIDFSRSSMRIFVIQSNDGKDVYHHFKLRLPKWKTGVEDPPKKLLIQQARKARNAAKKAEALERQSTFESAVSGYTQKIDDSRPYDLPEYDDWRDYDENRGEVSEPLQSEPFQPEPNENVGRNENAVKREPVPESKANVTYQPIYSGSAIVCFETVTLEEPAGVRVLVLRILQVVDPIEPVSGIQHEHKLPKIKKGSLFPWINPHTLEGAPWYWPRPDRPADQLTYTLMSLPEFPRDTSA